MSLKVNRNGNFQVGNTASGGSPASGTIEITENGVYDVTAFAEADVQTPVPSGKITITQNGDDIDIAQYASADVNVQGSGGISVDEDYTISEGVLTAVTTELNGDVIANIPNGVTTLGGSAFSNNVIISKVIMPNSVTEIEDGAPWSSVKGCLYGCTRLSNIIMSTSLTTIGTYAFNGCKSLLSITIPNSVTTIGRGAFGGCTGLTSITIPNSVTSIGEESFNGCTSIPSIIIGSGVTNIDDNAFIGCTSLTDIYYTGTQAQWEQIQIGESAIPQGVTIHYEYTPS